MGQFRNGLQKEWFDETYPEHATVQEQEPETSEEIPKPEESIPDKAVPAASGSGTADMGPKSDTQEPEATDYQVGDTVHIEGTAYEVTEIGMFDVELRDISQEYPIFRVENKDRLNDMLQRDSGSTTQLTTDAEKLEFMETEVIQEGADTQTISVPEPQNFKITDIHLGEGGPKAKFRMNMKAITVLKQVEAEGRTATPDRKSVGRERV